MQDECRTPPAREAVFGVRRVWQRHRSIPVPISPESFDNLNKMVWHSIPRDMDNIQKAQHTSATGVRALSLRRVIVSVPSVLVLHN